MVSFSPVQPFGAKVSSPLANRLAKPFFGNTPTGNTSTLIEKDAIVIGAGPGGYPAAIRLAQLGQRVTIIDQGPLGGTCLNVGCIPSKVLIKAADTLEATKAKAPAMGIQTTGVSLDFTKTQAWKEGILRRSRAGIAQLLKANGVEFVQGKAQLQDGNTVLVSKADGSEPVKLAAKNIVIATGGKINTLASMPFDHQVVIDSTDALNLQTPPKHLVLIGGGVIGLELGMAYAKLGSKVTVVEVMPKLLSFLEPEIVSELEKSLKKLGITVYTGTKPENLQVENGEARLELVTPDQNRVPIQADKVLVAVGRSPNSQGLGLETVGVQVGQRGHIQVDEQCRTNIPSVFAIGDVTMGAGLAHRAHHEGLMVAEVIANQSKPDAPVIKKDNQQIPSAIFTSPEIATVGLTEKEAKEKGFTVKTGKVPFAISGMAQALNDTAGFIKVVADANTNKLLGVHMVGPHVSELLAEAAMAVNTGKTVEDIGHLIHAHPTLPEVFQDAVAAVDGLAINYFAPKRPAAG
jgi:dihydrolipoamide dehydrogenase